MKNTNRLGLAFCLGALLAFSASACATLPASTPSARIARDAATCLQKGPCVVLQVDNGGFYEAEIRVNGAFVGRLDGNHSATLFVRESALVDGSCAKVSVYFRAIQLLTLSSKECVRPGGRFSLAVDPLYHTWLTPWGGS